MVCIKCSSDTKVVNSRPHKKTPSVWRRRQCTACTATFTTSESVSNESYTLHVVDGTGTSTFSFPKLMISLFQVFGHHPVREAADECYWLAQTISQDLQASATDSVTKADLVAMTFGMLKRYDEVAAAQYGAKHGAARIIRNQKPRRGRPPSRHT